MNKCFTNKWIMWPREGKMPTQSCWCYFWCQYIDVNASVLVVQGNMLFLEKFTPLAKILHSCHASRDKFHLCASGHLHENQIHCAFDNAYCWWYLSELCFSKCQILLRLWVVTLAAFVWHIFVTLTPLISSISPTKGEEDALSKERKVSPNRPGLAQMVTFTKSQSLYLSASKHSYLPENLLTRS